jgi:hypothetical protein
MLSHCIGLHMSFTEVRECLMSMNSSHWSLEQLKALMKAMPTDIEREALAAYLQVSQQLGQK